MELNSVLAQFTAENPGMEVIDLVGAGAGGAVYKCHQIELNRTVAVKLLTLDLAEDGGTARARFEREARILSTLDHPSVPRFYAYGLIGNKFPYIIMDYVQGESLADMLKNTGVLSWSDVATIALQLCSTLKYLEEKSVDHRDLNLHNILIAGGVIGKTSVRLVDFGFAARADLQQLTAEGEVLGTIQYLSPEVRQGGRRGVAADIYSLGCIFYRCLTGQLPDFGSGDKLSLLPLKSSGCDSGPARFADVVRQCIRLDPGLRYPTIDALSGDIERVLDGLPPKLVSSLREHPARANRTAHLLLILASFATLVFLWCQQDSLIITTAARMPVVGADPIRAATSNFILGRLRASGNEDALQQFQIRMIHEPGLSSMDKAVLCLRFARESKGGKVAREWLLRGVEQVAGDTSAGADIIEQLSCELDKQISSADEHARFALATALDSLVWQYEPQDLPATYSLLSKLILRSKVHRPKDTPHLLSAIKCLSITGRQREALILLAEAERFFDSNNVPAQRIFTMQLRLGLLDEKDIAGRSRLAKELVAATLNARQLPPAIALATSCDALVAAKQFSQAYELLPQLEKLVAQGSDDTRLYTSIVLVPLRAGRFAEAELKARKLLSAGASKDGRGEVLRELLIESLVGQHKCSEAAKILVSLLEDPDFRLVPYHILPAVRCVNNCNGDDASAALTKIDGLLKARGLTEMGARR